MTCRNIPVRPFAHSAYIDFGQLADRPMYNVDSYRTHGQHQDHLLQPLLYERTRMDPIRSSTTHNPGPRAAGRMHLNLREAQEVALEGIQHSVTQPFQHQTRTRVAGAGQPLELSLSS